MRNAFTLEENFSKRRVEKRRGWARIELKELHNDPASFETHPLGAPQDENKPLMALRKSLILRRSRTRPSRRTHGLAPADQRFLAQPRSALRQRWETGV